MEPYLVHILKTIIFIELHTMTCHGYLYLFGPKKQICIRLISLNVKERINVVTLDALGTTSKLFNWDSFTAYLYVLRRL